MIASFSRDEMAKSLDKKIKKYISLSGNCAQTAFLTLQEQFGLEDGAILKALTPFPGGIALMGGTCGVIIGCTMALGLVFGKEKMNDITGFYNSMPKVREFYHIFEKKMGGTTCREIAKSDFRKWYKRVNLTDTGQGWDVNTIKHRTKVVQTGVRIAADILLQKKSGLINNCSPHTSMV